MIWNIISFELKYRFKRPATYIYFFIFLAISFMLVALPEATVVESGDKLNKNAPELMSQLILVIMMYGSVICAAIMGVPVYRDYEHNFHEIIFSLPVKKWEYLWGRFIGSYIISVIVFSGIILGLFLGNIMPWQDPEIMGPFMAGTYLFPFLIYVIPNMFILGSLFFAVGSLFRSQAAIYAQGVLFMVLYFGLSLFAGDIDFNPVNSLWDPFGSIATSYVTKYWTTYEKNTLLVPVTEIILTNRMLWIGIASIISLLFTLAFKTSKDQAFFIRRISRANFLVESVEYSETETGPVSIEFTLKTKFYQWWYLSKFYFRRIISSIPFLIMILCGVGFMSLSRYGTLMYGTPSLPVTYMLLDILVGGFMLFLIVIIIVYSGEIIWKDISIRFSPILDSSPLANAQIMISKFTAMILAELLLMLVIILSGIGVQVFNQFYDFQILIYVKYLMLNIFSYLFIITLLTFFIHTLVDNKFLGHGLIIIFYVLTLFSSKLGISHILFKYGDTLTESYSGMNKFQQFVMPALTTGFYWLMLGIVLMTISIMMMKRGTDQRFRARLNSLFLNWKMINYRIVILTSLILFILAGGFIFYNTNILNDFRGKKKWRHFQALYEIKYNKYEHALQPRIADIKVEVDIYPEKMAFHAKGTYLLINKNKTAVDSVHLRKHPDIDINNVTFGIPVIMADSSDEYGYYIYILEKALAAGDSMVFNFDIDYKQKGFSNWGKNKYVLPNGTFFTSEMLPYFGYDDRFVLKEKRDRKKEGLIEKEFTAAELNDTSAYMNTYINHNADRISYEAILSTDIDQVALTCGTVQKEWVENGRKFFKYKMDGPIWNFFPFLSAKYEVVNDRYNGIDISIYYNKGHDYNIDKMIKAIKKTIAYCEENFYPYQHKEIRIVEFPRYAEYAQSFAGIIPFSEGIGFITDMDDKNDIDLPFYVASHEVAHQWWAHHECPADVKGKLLMVESLANYTALMVMEKEYGTKNISRFLKYEQDRYLMNRALEKKNEPPLYLVDEQTYAAYNKGSVVFYSLRDLIGEKNLNTGLSDFIHYYSYREPPYPTSIDFLKYIEGVTPDSLKYLLNDLFKTITLYSNRVDSAYFKESANNRYDIYIYTTTQKYRSDSLGKQAEVNPEDWIDVGVFTNSSDGKDSLIYLKKESIRSKNDSFHYSSEVKPTKVGIDPQNKLIDRNLPDNIKSIKSKS